MDLRDSYLSRDEWHDPGMVDDEVLALFQNIAKRAKNNDHSKSLLDIGDAYRTGRHVERIGRGRWVGDAYPYKYYGQHGCACGDVVATPDGTLWRCACLQEKIGTAERGILKDYRNLISLCSGENATCSQRHLPIQLLSQLQDAMLPPLQDRENLDALMGCHDQDVLEFGHWEEADGIRHFVPKLMTKQQCLVALHKIGIK